MSERAPILVVEDDHYIQSLISDWLALTGYPVVTADDGGVALHVVQRRSVALVLLDMRMPVMDGWAFAREYRARVTAPAPVVVVTAVRDAATCAAGVGAVAYLGKPFELDELLGLVKRHALSRESALD